MRIDAPALYADHDEREQLKPAYAYHLRHIQTGVAYTWTSYERSLTVYNLPTSLESSGTATFTPVQIMHGPLEASADYQQKSFQVTVATIDDMIRRFFVTAAVTKIRVTIIRLNAAALALAGTAQLDYQQDGLIVGGGLLGETVMSGSSLSAIVTPEVFFIDAQIPRYYFQALCNHVLYDSTTCRASKNSDGSNVNNADPWQKSFDIDWQAGNRHYQGGYLIHTPTGGRFAINQNTGSKIYLAYWSPDIKDGDWVTLFPGCSHTRLDCQNKFNNLANFGGFPYIPDQNPVYHGI